MDHSTYIKELKERYSENGITALSECERTDLLLSYAAPKKDMREASRRLSESAEGKGTLFRSSRSRIMDELDLSKSAALFPEILLATVSRAMTEQFQNMQMSDEDIGRMLVYKYLGHKVETVYLTLLDSNRRLIDTVLINEGSVNDAIVISRKLLEQSISRRAKFVALSHNHPSGDPAPSDADRSATEYIMKTFAYSNLEFSGHYIVAGKEYVLIKQ